MTGNVPCAFCQSTDRFDWGPVTMTKTSVAALLGERYKRFASLDSIRRVEVREATPTGRPLVIAVVDASGREERLPVENFRLALDPHGSANPIEPFSY